ncbi:MAG TPA: zf-HC2 domain-containing protein [Candidatus Paceibacterota bacterium]|nr:zf-HC2 domain-containing protein [Candidatus Paceibacterota bacterium]
MKCEECLAWLEGYVEGDLDDPITEDISAHLAKCAACASACEVLRREQEAYTRYFLAAEPTQALAANFQKGLEREKAARAATLPLRLQQLLINAHGVLRRRSTYAAAFVLIALAAILGLIGHRASGPGPRPDEVAIQTGAHPASIPSSKDAEAASAAERTGEVEAPPERTGVEENIHQGSRAGGRQNKTPSKVGARFVRRPGQKIEAARGRSLPSDSVRRAEQQYLSAIGVLLRDMLRRRGHLDAGQIAQLGKALADLDRTIDDTRRAVRERPNDPLAVMYMTTAYEKKVEVLRQLLGS